MTYHKKSYPHRPWTTTLNLANGNARLVTLAPGLRPERRFAPLARGQYFLQEHVYAKIEQSM